MTDHTELKRLATRIVEVQTSQDVPISKLFDDFDAATSPEVILALIAENERLIESDQEATELCDTLSALLGKVAVSVRGPEEPKSRHGFHDLPSRVKTVVAERDQLKAENEALRKDAARYQWLRSRESAADPEISVTRWNKISPDRAMGDAPRLEVLDAAIDSAMGKEEQS